MSADGGYAGFCVIIPAFNEEERVAAVVSGARAVVSRVIVVDDGSSDATAEKARAAGAAVLRHGENRGKGAALHTGLEYALAEGFEAAITVDADGQHDVAEIPAFIEEYVASHADIVVGSRMRDHRGMPIVRAVTNRLTSSVLSLIAGQRITDSQSGFRLIRCATAARLPVLTTRYDAESEIIVRAIRSGMKVSEIPIKTIYGARKSKINPVVDTCRFLRLVWSLLRERESERKQP